VYGNGFAWGGQKLLLVSGDSAGLTIEKYKWLICLQLFFIEFIRGVRLRGDESGYILIAESSGRVFWMSGY
jgi:hypothetical protein